MTTLVDACVGNSTGVGAASGIGLLISQALCDWGCQHIPAYALQVGKGMPLCSRRKLCRSQLIIWHCIVGHTGGLWMGPGIVLVTFRRAFCSPNACPVLASLSWVHDTVVLLILACPIVCATWTADVVYHRQQMLSIPAKPACNCISHTQSHRDAQPCCCSIPLKFGITHPGILRLYICKDVPQCLQATSWPSAAMAQCCRFAAAFSGGYRRAPQQASSSSRC